MAKRNLVEEISALRQRNSSNYAQGQLNIRLSQLQVSFEKRKAMPNEMLRYFPISLVGCVEAYSRIQIRELIDSGSPFVERVGELEIQTPKFDVALLRAIGSRAVTLGDLISHLLPINSFDNINSHLSVLTNRSFLEDVQTVQDRWKVEIEKQPANPIIDNAGEVFKWVQRTFELRHIFAHEFATAQRLDPLEIEQCFSATVIFLRATLEFSTNLLHPNAPLTQTDMNIRADEDYRQSEKELKGVIKEIVSKLPENPKEAFNRVQAAWTTYLQSSAEFEAAAYEGGTMRPLIYAVRAQQVTKERIESLRRDLKDIDSWEA